MKKDDNHNPDVKSKNIKKITWIGLGVNLFLSLLKFAVGIIGASQAVIADAVHSLSDMITDFAVIFGVKFWSAPADDDHPYGHSRIETLITGAIGTLLAMVGIGIAYEAITSVREAHINQPLWIALFGPLFSIIFKEVLYQWTINVGKKVNSSAVIANAWHHRSDALSSFPALAAVVAASIKPEWAFIDHIGALIVTIFILKVSWDITKPALLDLTDRGAGKKECIKIKKLSESVDGVLSVHGIRTRRMGPSLYVDLHIMVNENLTVRKGHEISHEVKRKLIDKGPEVYDVIVHIEPYKEPEK